MTGTSKALARIMDGNTCGFDRNEDGAFTFEVTGDEDPARDMPEDTTVG